MAVPNFVILEKTVDNDGIIEIDFENDGIQFGNTIYHATVIVTPNVNSALKGIRLLSGGSPLEFSETYQGWMYVLRAEDGTAVEVAHMDGGTDPVEQIYVPVLESTAFTAANHVFGIWRTGGPHRLNLYVPGTAPNVIYTTTAGTTAVASGVGEVFWSYTLAENEVIAGTVRIVGRLIDSGTTHDSYALAQFKARRSVGGSASVSVIAETEDGSFGAGTIATTASGNDVQIELTYTYTGDIDWSITADLGRVP